VRPLQLIAPFTCAGLIASFAAALSAQDGVPHFSNQAANAGVQFTHTNPVFFYEADYTGGGAAGDFDRNGRVDIFAVSGGISRDKLFINQGGGTFLDRALEWGLTSVHSGKGAACADYNDDGWLDLYITSAGTVGQPTGPGHHKLYRNNGNKSFTDVAAAAGVAFTHPSLDDGFGAAFGDYDLDGDLDLFVAGFRPNNNGSRLFKNDGDGTFTDVTAAIGFWSGTTIGVNAFAPRFADMDGDLYPELLIAGDFGTSRLFHNDTDGTFTDVTVSIGAAKDENGMGQTMSDYNGDGRPDWYVTSIYQPSLGWTGNKLYINSPSGQLNEIGLAADVHDGGYGWGAVSVDFDHDGLVDIAETNGDNGTPTFLNEQSYLWMNNGNGVPFTEAALTYGFAHFGAGRGLIDLDYDGDGDHDIGLFTNFGPFTLWRNDLTGNQIHWLRVSLDTTAHDGLPPDGYGSIVSARVGGNTQWRFVFGGDNFQSSSELVAHFGLGAATQVDELKVRWANGQETVLTNIPVDQTVVVSAPEDDQWTRAGLAIGGSNGVPQLRGSGSLLPLSPAGLSYTHGKPSTLLYMVFSFNALMAPFEGGTLMPAPDFIRLFATNAAGDWVVSGVTWPTGLPGGTQIWFQGWQQDPTGMVGWISSNGLKATTP